MGSGLSISSTSYQPEVSKVYEAEVDFEDSIRRSLKGHRYDSNIKKSYRSVFLCRASSLYDNNVLPFSSCILPAEPCHCDGTR